MFLTKSKKSRYYQIVFFQNGKQTSKSTHTSDRKTAAIILEAFRKSFDERSYPSPSPNSIKLKKFSDEYIELLKLSTSEAYIKRSVIPAFKHLYLYLGNVELHNITPQHIEKFLLEHFQKAKYSTALYYRVLKAAFRKAISWKYIDRNPFQEIRLPKIQRKATIFLTMDELKLIINKTDTKVMKDIFMFAFLTGMRLAELLNLTWDQVDLVQNFIQVGSNNFLTKSKKIRFIPLSIPAKNILIHRKPERIYLKDYYVFDKGNGFNLSSDYVSKKFKKALRKSGLDERIHFHTLRASFGSFLLQSGVPISYISNLLGHSSISVTERHYTRLKLSNLNDAIASFNSKWPIHYKMQ